MLRHKISNLHSKDIIGWLVCGWEGDIRNDNARGKIHENSENCPQINSTQPSHRSRLGTQHRRQAPRRMLTPIKKRDLLS